MTMPAITSPSSEIPLLPAKSTVASSLENPVMFASRTTKSARSAVSSNAAAVPSIAAQRLIPGPCEIPMVTIITASEPTSATSSGGGARKNRGRDELDHEQKAEAEPDQRAETVPPAQDQDQPCEAERQVNSDEARSKSMNANGC